MVRYAVRTAEKTFNAFALILADLTAKKVRDVL